MNPVILLNMGDIGRLEDSPYKTKTNEYIYFEVFNMCMENPSITLEEIAQKAFLTESGADNIIKTWGLEQEDGKWVERKPLYTPEQLKRRPSISDEDDAPQCPEGDPENVDNIENQANKETNDGAAATEPTVEQKNEEEEDKKQDEGGE